MAATTLAAGSSRALVEVLARLTEQLDGGADAQQLADDLFGVAGALDDEATLRRVLTEPSVVAQAREAIARSLFDGKIGEPALTVLAGAAGLRWSRARDLGDAVERSAVTAVAAAAERSGDLDAVEDDLFRFARILEANAELRDLLSNRAVPLDRRRGVLDGLVADKVVRTTKTLLDQLLVLRQRTLTVGLEHYQQIVAARRSRLVATVWAASSLTDGQRDRLAGALASQYEHEVHLNVIIDPDVLGGLRVSIGDDVIDSTIETRILQAERRLLQ